MTATDAKIAALEAVQQHTTAAIAELRQLIGQVAIKSEERMHRHEDGCNEFRCQVRESLTDITSTVSGIKASLKQNQWIASLVSTLLTGALLALITYAINHWGTGR
jgi:23S rRNA A1618 N6-methylase RlmF